MKHLTIIILFAISQIFLSGCASTGTNTTQGKINATATIGMELLTEAVLSTLLAKAQSPTDAFAKANWSDSLAEGVRQSTAKILSWNTISRVWNAWLPPAAPTHWDTIEKSVKAIVAEKKLSPEEVAMSLNDAAAKLRTAAVSS